MRTTNALIVITSFIGIVTVTIFIVFFVNGRPINHRVMLSWQSPVTVPGVVIASYNLYRSVSPGGPYVEIASRVNRLTYTDYIVNNGKTYYYVVTSVGVNGRESTYSNEARAKIP